MVSTDVWDWDDLKRSCEDEMLLVLDEKLLTTETRIYIFAELKCTVLKRFHIK